MTGYEVVPTGEKVTVGRRGYGGGWTGEVVTVGGDTFVRRDSDGMLAAQCGMDDPAWSGSKRWASHVLGGVCFQCNGRGTYGQMRTVEQTVALVKRRAADARRRDAAEEKRMAEQDAAHRAWVEANPEVVTMLAEVAADLPTESYESSGDERDYDTAAAAEKKWGGFLTDLAWQARYRPLTEGQTEAAAEAYGTAKARQAAKAAAEAVSRTYGAKGEKVKGVEGVVKVWTTYETNYSYTPQSNVLMVVEATAEGFEGVTFKITGTGMTLWETGRGDTVEVSGTVKDHGEYEGIQQTVLTRAKVKVLAAAEEDA